MHRDATGEMKDWPDFNDSGDLPPGIHQATLAEVIDHFGKNTPQRRIIARRIVEVIKND